MQELIDEITKGIDEMIKSILPHTGNFKTEVQLLSKKQEYFDKIDSLMNKYDKLIKLLNEENK